MLTQLFFGQTLNLVHVKQNVHATCLALHKKVGSVDDI
jgi:hypothetical protein